MTAGDAPPPSTPPQVMARGKVKMLPGPSVPEWRRMTARLNAFGWLEVFLLIPIGIFWYLGANWLIPVFLFCVCGFVQIQLYNLNFGSATKSEKEYRAGYSTDPDHYRADVHLVAPKTGLIIRAAGEPQITVEQYQDAIRHQSSSA